jgi:hypothetical protein
LIEVESLTPPTFRLRALPGVHDRDARGADGVRLDHRRVGDGGGF